MRFATLRVPATISLSLLATAVAAQQPAQQSSGRPATSAPPVANIVPRVDTVLGDVRVDNYFWLRDDKRRNPDVIAYLQAENAHTEAMLAHTAVLQEKLYQEMKGRIKETDLSVPERRGDYYYYSRTEQGRQYPILARKKGPAADEEVMLDENAMAQGTRYFRVGAWRVSPDAKRLAFLVDTTGAERLSLVVKDLATGTMLPDRADSANYSLEWAADSRTLFYGKSDAADRPNKVFRHELGAAAPDVEVASEPNELFNLEVGETKDHRYLVLASTSFNASEVRVLPADQPTGEWKMIRPREEGVEYDIDHHGHQFFIRTNEGALNFKVVTAPDSTPDRAHWRDFIPGSDSVFIGGITLFRNDLVAYQRANAQQRIRIYDLRSGKSHDVAFPERVYAVFGGANPEFDTNVLRFTYTSLVTPPTVYDYDMAKRTRDLKKKTDVIGYDPSKYGTERTWAHAADGTQVPVSLVYRKPLVKDGKRPLLLTGYGSYGASSDPAFNSTVVSLLDRGVIYAIAHIRGGSEMGRRWYDQGKLLNKKNTFTDFIASAEHLVQSGYTSSDRLAIRGGSAGGLLMGAVVNMRPDLFKAVVADVPFVDVINTMLDASIPLTTQEWIQWGDPHKAEYYTYMKSYAPYENVERKAYPAMLVTAGLNDPRVGYWEPAKWVAKLRANKTDANSLLLRTNMGAGHGGASGRYDALREQAIRFAFLLDQLGLGATESVSAR